MSNITITLEEYEELDSDYGGVCLACGEYAYGVEPDARQYTCESCDEKQVYGAQELLMMGLVV